MKSVKPIHDAPMDLTYDRSVDSVLSCRPTSCLVRSGIADPPHRVRAVRRFPNRSRVASRRDLGRHIWWNRKGYRFISADLEFR
jgi:hypothetical protein